MISIIVPACNESAVIARGLTAMAYGAEPGALEIIVVCNGCTDDTAEVARRFGDPVIVVETTVPSKVNALNLGDRVARGFPRFYVDADVVITLDSIREIVDWLAQGKTLAAAPTIRLDLSRCSWPVKAFYEIDCRMPSHLDGIGGSGVYALTETARKRFGEFPKITADDGFIRLSFTPQERCTVEAAYSIVTPPRNLAGLIKIKTRSHFGNAELRQLHPQLFSNSGMGNTAAIRSLLRRPEMWLELGVYIYVKLVARFFARRRMVRGNYKKWERDDTSRKIVSSAGARVFVIATMDVDGCIDSHHLL